MSSNRRMESGPSVSKLRMDRKPFMATRITDPSLPYGKRKEIDNLMKKARQSNPQSQSNEYWDKKLIIAEEKDPNRWRHTGYKKLYIGNGSRNNGNSSSEGERGDNREKFRSVAPRKSRSRSPRGRRTPQSPVQNRRRLSPPDRRRPRSPVAYRRSPPPKEMKSKEIFRPNKRPVSPPPKGRSPSLTSCSDDSCSVCSSDEGRGRPLAKGHRQRAPTGRVRPISPAAERISSKRHQQKSKTTMVKDVSPKRRHLKHPRPTSPPVKSRHLPLEPQEPAPSKKSKEKPAKETRTRVKIEGEKRRNRSPSEESEDSTSSESSIPTTGVATTGLTLSERFGKMAQWSNDRKYENNMENMKITKNSAGGDLKVLIQEGQNPSPPRARNYSPAPQGHFPEELLAQAPVGMAAWDDVRVRYEYYKGRGYLRDLDLQDYMKWESWWYRYQEWLKQERYYEMWERSQMNRRRPRKKLPITQRLN